MQSAAHSATSPATSQPLLLAVLTLMIAMLRLFRQCAARFRQHCGAGRGGEVRHRTEMRFGLPQRGRPLRRGAALGTDVNLTVSAPPSGLASQIFPTRRLAVGRSASTLARGRRRRHSSMMIGESIVASETETALARQRREKARADGEGDSMEQERPTSSTNSGANIGPHDRGGVIEYQSSSLVTYRCACPGGATQNPLTADRRSGEWPCLAK